jgi:hypothetical protein
VTPSGLLLFADRAASVGSGAVLTLVLPLGITMIAFVLWYFAFPRNRG